MKTLVMALTLLASASAQIVNNGNVNGLMAVGTRPDANGKIEIEAADDFILSTDSTITRASFTGLLTGGATTSNIGSVTVEIYRVFPKDSAVPPSGSVPTRANSPSDFEFASRISTDSSLTFTTTVVNATFVAANSVLNGIHKIPTQTTGGEGPVSGQEVQFDVIFNPPIDLPADHYFFVPQVQVTGGEFMWLSSVRPIVAPGIPFTPDLQAWVRNATLDPDWLRVGTDIVGGVTPPTFNLAFSLDGLPGTSDVFFLSFFFN